MIGLKISIFKINDWFGNFLVLGSTEDLQRKYVLYDLIKKQYFLLKVYYGIFFEPVFCYRDGIFNFFIICGLSFLLIVCLLIAIAYYTLAERKVMAFMQRRRGPNVVGFWGLLQPLADGVKLALKEIIIPRKSNSSLFLFAPILTFILALISWSVIPFNYVFSYSELNFGLIFLLAISSLGVYGIIIAGWASNSNYAFLGALRSTAQMISYEITISFVILIIVFFSGSFNLMDIVTVQHTSGWLGITLFPLMLIFFVCMLAETNRAPFDLPEAEAELVAGYNIDYSSITFALFFLGEYSNMLLMSTLMVILFLGGWAPMFGLKSVFYASIIFACKIIVVAFTFIWVRATLPRYRYDQLMSLGWKMFLPFTFGFFLFSFGLFFFFSIEYNFSYSEEHGLRVSGPFPLEGYAIWSKVMERTKAAGLLSKSCPPCSIVSFYKEFAIESKEIPAEFG